jgi:hypothetical protein
LGEDPKIIDLDYKVLVPHLYQEANQCVDVLANQGCSMVDGRVFFFMFVPIVIVFFFELRSSLIITEK